MMTNIIAEKLKEKYNRKGFTRKGFTLVEVIVVLIILAILAAVLVPKLTGWIDQSRGKAAVGEGHLVLAAAQTVTAQAYAAAASSSDAVGDVMLDVANTWPNATTFKNLLAGDVDIVHADLYGLDYNGNTQKNKLYIKSKVVRAFRFKAANGWYVRYNGDGTFDAARKSADLPLK